ncbi:MAG: hypothetical protein SGI96_03810 [Bacteroidota bacterium]|nr:hypothetical protein [Bacteroidota bacterium]
MQTARIVQAVVLMMIVVMAASCAASKEYSSKLFSPRIPVAKDSQAVALRFLEIDSVDKEKEDWVSTDVIMGRDTVSKTLALDKLAIVYPASPATVDSIVKVGQAKTTPVFLTESKPIPVESVPVAKNANPGEIRTKKTRE